MQIVHPSSRTNVPGAANICQLFHTSFTHSDEQKTRLDSYDPVNQDGAELLCIVSLVPFDKDLRSLHHQSTFW